MENEQILDALLEDEQSYVDSLLTAGTDKFDLDAYIRGDIDYA
tara:strand:+ start:114 stop:242 length:129 start_codon:yes stop_codon:yes gene_type:complete